MSITALLPDPAAIHIDYIRPSLSAIALIVRTTDASYSAGAKQSAAEWILTRL